MEANNMKAMREALEEIWKEANTQYWNDNGIDLTWLMAKAKSALSAPPRNCDVGTAEEQAVRYGRYCDKFTQDGMHCESCPCCGKIPLGRCEFAWAQMPYESEVAK